MNFYDNAYLAALCASTGLPKIKLPELMDYFGSAQAVFEAGADVLAQSGILSKETALNFATYRIRTLPEKIIAFCHKQGAKLISWRDEEYPESLLYIHSLPRVLFVKGILPREPYCFGVVGSRRCSPYGRRAAEFFTRDLAARGIPIISGGARGIDTAAHQAALDVGGKTVAVLGCSLDIVYPEENARLFERIVANGGAVISEYAPVTQPLAQNFPARNRIIAGLTQGILVAEAAQKSGAIITANFAVDEGRDVYCVPGNIFDQSSKGCHDLIRLGAKLVDRPEDILEDILTWQQVRTEHTNQASCFDFMQDERKRTPAPKINLNLSELGTQLLQHLQGGASTLENLVELSGSDCASVSMELLELQSLGILAQDQAQRYYRR